MTAPIDYEQIAVQIHEFYEADPKPHVFGDSYAKLPEFMKEDNRLAARRIGTVLAAAGLGLARREGSNWSPEEQSQILAIIMDRLEILAEAEHDGWVDARLRQGWRPISDEPKSKEEKLAHREQRLHHLLIPYDGLPEDEKKKDRNGVQNYVEIISGTQYQIVPLT